MIGTDHKPRVVANTSFQEVLAQLSPDVRWVAYQTNESGRFEVVVQAFPDAGGKWQVSTGGGAASRWRADGKELYFLSPDATMMAVPDHRLGRDVRGRHRHPPLSHAHRRRRVLDDEPASIRRGARRPVPDQPYRR